MHRADLGAILNARQPLHRLAAGTTLLAVTALWLPPAASAAPTESAPVTAEAAAWGTDTAAEDAAEEARMVALERADRAARQPVTQPVAPTTPPPVIAVPPQTGTAPPQPKSPATPKSTKPAKPTPKKPTVKQPAVKKPATKPPATAVKPPSGAAGTVVSYAMAQVGKAYVYGASGPNAFDCSGLVSASYAKVGIKLPHQSESIAAKGRRVPAGQAMPGDVMHSSGHVGIYIGGGKMVAATKPGTGVKVGPAYGTPYRFL